MNRRQFFKKLPHMAKDLIAEEKPVIRPPYFSEEHIQKCKKCEGFCVTACEERIIFRLEDGSPYLEFRESGCTFCRKCSDACLEDVISYESLPQDKIKTTIRIQTQTCLAWNKTICNSCRDVCIENAVKFLGLFNPQIDHDRCTSCGFCVAKCPVSAVQTVQKEEIY
ncbi:MAG: ferredoxin-type protein NapF [Aquificae bacterium]|nr:ferredoxin-type protein NapF [Aquificota bacterium]